MNALVYGISHFYQEFFSVYRLVLNKHTLSLIHKCMGQRLKWGEMNIKEYKNIVNFTFPPPIEMDLFLNLPKVFPRVNFITQFLRTRVDITVIIK